MKEMGLLDDLLDAGKDVAQQQLGQLLQQLGQEGECGRFGVMVWCGQATQLLRQLGQE